MVDLLNERFIHGHASNDLDSAGVLLRQFDGLSDWDQGQPWLPCRPDKWCNAYQHWWPASLINSRVRHLYYASKGGMVLRSSTRLNCVYPGDGNSMGSVDKGGCNPNRCTPQQDWDCAYPPGMLKDALEAGQRRGGRSHNELILDLDSITPSLPFSILAFFCIVDCDQVRGLQQSFVNSYGISDEECPVVGLNLGETPPFSLV